MRGQNGPLSSSSSERSQSSDENRDETERDPVASAREWDPETVMYRNKNNKIVDLVLPVGGAGSFSCGIHTSDGFEVIKASPFLNDKKVRKLGTVHKWELFSMAQDTHDLWPTL